MKSPSKPKSEYDDWKELIDVDFPKLGEIDDEAVENMRKHAERYRGSFRMATGRVWTDSAYEERRKQVWNTPLPS